MKSHKHLAHFEPHSLLIAAARYWIGRRTIAATCFAEELAKAWQDIPDKTRTIIRRDLENEFERDDRARDEGGTYHPLGDDCDRQAWEKVREAWRKEEA